jgi:hypothetical protein
LLHPLSTKYFLMSPARQVRHLSDFIKYLFSPCIVKLRTAGSFHYRHLSKLKFEERPAYF